MPRVQRLVNVAPDVKCGRCGGPVFVKNACCGWKNKGYAKVVKCLRGCGWKAGYVPAPPQVAPVAPVGAEQSGGENAN